MSCVFAYKARISFAAVATAVVVVMLSSRAPYWSHRHFCVSYMRVFYQIDMY